MAEFLSFQAIQSLWMSKVLSLSSRHRHSTFIPESLLTGSLKEDLGLDSLEIFELAAHFHGMFHLMEGKQGLSLLPFQTVEEWLKIIHAAANDWEKPITFYTSGSTGEPKPCLHDKRLLVQEINAWQQLFSPSGKIWRHVSPQHIYGFLFGTLLPDRLGLEVRAETNMGHEGLESSDWVIGFPELYEIWNRSHLSFPEGITAICSTAPLASQTAASLAKLGLHVIEIYGSSESAGIGHRQFPQEAFQLLPYWTLEGGSLRRTNPLTGVTTALQPMDHLDWQEGNTFRVSGRKDSAIQIGGHNVFPDRIARQIEKIPGVQKCWIRPMNRAEGNRLKCWIIPDLPKEEWLEFETTCYAWIEENLDVAQRPRHLVLSALPPVNSIGKSADWSIISPS